jgi:hypothetical protein
VREVDVYGVQSHLRAEPTKPTEQAVGAPLRGGRSHLPDPEAGMIESFSLLINFSYYLLVCNVGFYVVEEKYWGQTPLLGHLAACARR